MSKISYNSKKHVFLTQDEPKFNESVISRHNPSLISSTHELSTLKKKYDTVKQENIKKIQYLKWLEGKVFELKSTAGSIKVDIDIENDRFQDLQIEIENASSLLEQELEMKKILQQILLRNRSESTNLDVKVNKFGETLKTAKLKMDLENEKARRSKELKFNSKVKLGELKDNLLEDTKKQFTQIINLESSINQRRELLRKYDQRVKRQAEVVEIAAKNDRKVHEKEVREKITANKMLYDMLRNKEIKMKKDGKEFESAFQDIKTKTGHVDPKVIVNNFMVREETINNLILSVENSETTLEALKKEYESLKENLKELYIINDKSSDNTTEDKNLAIDDAYKQLEKAKIQHRKTSFAFKEMTKWSKRISSKINIKDSDNFTNEIKLIYFKIKELTDTVKNDPKQFEKNLEEFNFKKTDEIIKEIYNQTPRPNRVQEST